jgi:hypothetical protein
MNDIKKNVVSSALSANALLSFTQKAFTGVAKYCVTVVGASANDAASFVFDKNNILQNSYLPDTRNPEKINKITIINNFTVRKLYPLNVVAETDKANTLPTSKKINGIHTKKMAAKSGTCFHYKANSLQVNKSNMIKVGCLAYINAANKHIQKFWLTSTQPITITTEIVMDLIVTEPDSNKPQIYILDILSKAGIADYFNPTNYKKLK